MAQIQPLSPELQKIAIEELGEVPSRVDDDLLALKTWIHQQPHLKARTDDQFLVQFLRGCKYSLERAKKKLDHFYALTSKYPELLAARNVDMPVFREIHNLGILVFRIKYSVGKHSIEEALLPCNTMHELLMVNDPYACIHGLFYILDFDNATASHFLQFTPSVIKRLVTFYEKTLPFRIKAWCYINVSPVAEQFFKIILPCISEKLRQRVFIYGKNMAKLTSLVPLKYLPQEYGGENGSLQQIAQDYNKVWDEYREYFKQNADYGTEERLRSGKPMDFDGQFGLCGSFRKINVD